MVSTFLCPHKVAAYRVALVRTYVRSYVRTYVPKIVSELILENYLSNPHFTHMFVTIIS